MIDVQDLTEEQQEALVCLVRDIMTAGVMRTLTDDAFRSRMTQVSIRSAISKTGTAADVIGEALGSGPADFVKYRPSLFNDFLDTLEVSE